MKTSVCRTLLRISCFLLLNSALSAQSNFFNANCGSNTGIGSFCPVDQTIDINVSGLSTLGVNNFGLVEVFIDFNSVGTFFNSDFTLVSPNGSEFILASINGLNNSFPNWPGGSAGVSFVPCLDYPTTSQAGSSINLETYQPIDDFTTLNDDMINPNGIWKIKSCVPVSGDVPFNIFCVRMVFDNICTEATNIMVNNPECAGGEAEIIFDVNPGICPGIWASVDNVNYQSFSDLEGNQLFTTDANVNTLYIEDSQPGTAQNSDCAPTETAITIAPTDNQFPSIECPAGFDVFLDENCTASFSITDPDITDNCSLSSSTVTYTNPDGDILGPFTINSGTIFTYGWLNTAGIFTFEWVAIDDAGNSTTCLTTINVKDNTPPEFLITEINITGECGVDDYDLLFADALASLDVIEACEMEVFIFPVLITEEEIICGNAIEYLDKYQTGNDNGPFDDIYSPNLATITIELLDNLAPEITGMTQNDVTISCNEVPPSTPQIGVDVFSIDACQGDITGDMTLSISSTFGDCLSGQPEEVVTYVYSSIDVCGNEATESFTITIINDVAPEFNAPFDNGNFTLSATCGVDNLSDFIAANVPSANGCNGPASVTLISETAGDLCDASGGANSSSSTVLVYQAEDDCNNTAMVSLTIDYLDLTPPILNGIPASITLSCTDSSPNFPTVTANDACAGDVSDLIEYDFSLAILSCSINQDAVVLTHTWTATDYCGNIQVASWTVTTFNDEAVELGNNITACTGEAVVINATGLTGDYQWSTGETTQGITVVDAGTYSITVTSPSGCCSEDNITVTYQDFPDATATGGTLDCSGEDIMITGSSTTTGATYTWFGPGGFTSTEQNPLVNQAGTYTLSVTSPAGCTTTDDALVVTDIDVPDLSTSGGTIDCITSTVTITGSSTTAGVSYAWTGPGGFTTSEQNPTVSVSGNYMLVVSAPNGCIAEGLAVVVNDTEIPTATASGGTLDCDFMSVNLMGASSDPNAGYAWTGPGGFTSDEQNPEVTLPGEYQLTVTGINGCTNSTMAAVIVDEGVPIATIGVPSLDCDDQSITISVEATEDYTYEWTLDGSVISTSESVTISEAGNYSVVITAENGCTVILSYSLDQDLEALTAEITTTDATASAGGTAEIVISNIDLVASILWDNGQSGPSATDLDIGTHTVTVTDLLGCTYLFTFEVMMSTAVSDLHILKDFVVYPTLAQNYITVDAKLSLAEGSTIQILDVNGRKLVQNTFARATVISERLIVDHLTSGVYFLTIRVGNEMKATKFIKI